MLLQKTIFVKKLSSNANTTDKTNTNVKNKIDEGKVYCVTNKQTNKQTNVGTKAIDVDLIKNLRKMQFLSRNLVIQQIKPIPMLNNTNKQTNKTKH